VSFFGYQKSPRLLTWLIVVGLATLVVVAAVREGPKSGTDPTTFPVWVISSLERAGPRTPAGATTSAKLFAARGEYEAFQLVIKAPITGLRNVNVVPSALAASIHQTISASNITLYREHFVNVESPSPDWQGPNRSVGVGWYPDPLIPFTDSRGKLTQGSYRAVPFDLAPGDNQPIWVEVFTPREASAGQYHGTVMITSDQGSQQVALQLTVWDFDLPLAPSFKSCFVCWTPLNQEALEELLKHKIMPRWATSSGLRPTRPGERDLMDRLGLMMVDTGLWGGADRDTCTMQPAPSVQEFQQAAKTHEPDLYLFNYTADEIGQCKDLEGTIKQWARNMHRAGIRNLVVMSPTPELFDDGSGTGRSAVDIWVVLPMMYDNALEYVTAARKKGDEIWSYNTLVQDRYSPKWLIDYDPINLRVQAGFISQCLNLTGLFYWGIDRWTSDPWKNVNNRGMFGEGNYPGEGVLVYPGQPAGVSGVVPSIRLKQLRDGIEDYEYVEILKKLGRGQWAVEMARSVAPDWANWRKDPGGVEMVRQRLGEEIQRLVGRSEPAPAGRFSARSRLSKAQPGGAVVDTGRGDQRTVQVPSAR